ncbi:zinc finger protein 845-like [Bradysia coprophila]|uniref:zinc finger protein 845-like n=1 Tax=Bradysia coprophila TaxID=38358 RepID=UPI00187D78CA|nr:zinc finger protein 845-like [Bradysia coprophila]
MEIDFSSPICRLCLTTDDTTLSPTQPNDQLFTDIFELMQIEIVEIPAILTVICGPCRSKVEMFVEFKKICVSSNYRFITKDLIKLETPPIETPDEVWRPDSDSRDIKPVVDETDQSTAKVDVLINNKTNIDKFSMKKTKSEREICSYCGKLFLFLSQHIRSMHTGTMSNQKRFSCGLCFEKFSERSLLKLHIDSTHDGKMYQCDICGKKDKSLGGLTRHIRSHSKVRPYSCELCGKLFRYSKHLFEHKLRHANNRRFKCEICEKRFFTHTEISSHKLIHASDRSFKCKVCGKGFKRPDHVRSHMRIHLKDKSFACKICDKEFSFKHNMVFHMKNVHGTMTCNSKQ